MASPILKVSVLVSGAVLLDGEQITLDGLGAKLEHLKEDRPVVWYYREASGGEPPPVAMEVMKLVVGHSLPIGLSSKPDFSDYVDRKGVSHPRYATWDGVVAKVREMTAGGRYVGIIRPDRSYLLTAPPRKEAMPPTMIQMMEKLVPPTTLRKVGVIADTYFSWKVGGGAPSLAEMAQAIPFFGMLLGLACIGHSVCVVTGQDDSIASGCKDADLLIVDDAQLAVLPSDWKTVGAGVMRNANIVVHERATFKLKTI